MSQYDLLFELGTEELPPKALKTLSDALRDNFAANLQSNDFTFDSIEKYATPRRLALIIRNLADSQPDKNVERLGPAVAAAFNDDGSAKPAAVGFAKSCGVEVDQLDRIETDKGERLGYTIAQKGQPLSELIEDMLNSALKNYRFQNQCVGETVLLSLYVRCTGQYYCTAHLYSRLQF